MAGVYVGCAKDFSSIFGKVPVHAEEKLRQRLSEERSSKLGLTPPLSGFDFYVI
jgi:hypothetical protein